MVRDSGVPFLTENVGEAVPSSNRRAVCYLREMDFQRARSEEQREARRQAILATTAAMLAEFPVAKVSLNEVSRRVGLAKSNVLRYFESREAILLELLDEEGRSWIAELSQQLQGERPVSALELSGRIAATLAAHPVLCDLLHAEAGVLERNVSTEVVLRHKRATQALAVELVGILTTAMPELGPDAATEVIVTVLLVAAAAWPYAQPGEALTAAYQADASVAVMHREFTDLVSRTTCLTIQGLLAEQPPRPTP